MISTFPFQSGIFYLGYSPKELVSPLFVSKNAIHSPYSPTIPYYPLLNGQLNSGV